MSADPIALTTINGGITRARVKGAALRNSLYDLVNGYVTIGKTVKVRPGTFRHTDLTPESGAPDTVGLVAFQGVFHVFCHVQTTVPAGYVLDVLSPPVAGTTLVQVHFAAPYMGFLYVVGEFSDGTTAHYWLQSDGTWQANNVYLTGDYVTPSVLNGFAYLATRVIPPNSVWSPSSTIALNAIVEPTVPNGYMFQAIAVAGTNPHTGTAEPTWPTTENAQIQEFGDFSTTVSTNPTDTTTVQTPSQSITDRYGNSAVFTSQGTTIVSTAPTIIASTTISTWAAGALYQPGAVVQPSTGQGAVINAIPNGDFEDGDDGNWILGTGWTIGSFNPYQGTLAAEFGHTGAVASNCEMNTYGTVTPGQSVTAGCYGQGDSDGAVFLVLRWYDSGHTHISDVVSPTHSGGGGSNPSNYSQITVTGNAPSNAAFVRVAVQYQTGSTHARAGRADLVSWNLETPAAASPFLFEAVQAAAGTSASTEPTWPVVEGGEVVDGGVTWEAVGASIITWQALPIMKSGSPEPIWPTELGGAIADGNMSWVAASRQITDPKCPQSKIVTIAASKVFAADKDIIAFSATTNCLDWSSANDAGFLPFGLQTYGAEPCEVLGLYRSNLLAFNSTGYQMWQVDEDPANMAFLDGSPVGSHYPKSGAPVDNDFVFLTVQGIRSIGIAGASTNLQAGSFGKNVDPLVKAAIKGGDTPIALFYPGTGQYMLFFGAQAFVLTMNGGTQDQSWSRYTFPAAIQYWTVEDGVLYLRAGDLVWEMSEDALYDDIVDSNTFVEFTGKIQWPYLDFGTLGIEKTTEGFDLVCEGNVNVTVGYNQKDFTKVTPDYIVAGDTLDEVGMVPIEITAPSMQWRLEFSAGQAWEWEALNVYVIPSKNT